jgi:hypothetical protein
LHSANGLTLNDLEKELRSYTPKKEYSMIKSIEKLSLIAFTFFCSTLAIQAQEGAVSIEQHKDIDKLLDFKKDLSTVNAFTIQVYSGSSSVARNEAQTAKTKAASLYPNWSNSIEYEQPNYKIWVGNFRTRLEADRALIEVKKIYTNAFILSPRNNK